MIIVGAGAIDLAFISILLAGWVMSVIDRMIAKRFGPGPHCDIDPRCHPAFAWDKYGRGWIGNVKVKT